jgi:hypothetical protein
VPLSLGTSPRADAFTNDPRSGTVHVSV